MRLETERLLIEPLTHQDLDALATIEADSLVRRYIDNKTMTRQQVADYIDTMLRSYEENGYGRFAVKAKADGALIGLCGFIDEDYGVDFGYRYARSSWGPGAGNRSRCSGHGLWRADIETANADRACHAGQQGVCQCPHQAGFQP